MGRVKKVINRVVRDGILLNLTEEKSTRIPKSPNSSLNKLPKSYIKIPPFMNQYFFPMGEL
jgi:hypothetical protein